MKTTQERIGQVLSYGIAAHPKHKILTPEFINKQTGKFLHRFSWLEDEEIGELPIEWNWLAIEYPENPLAKLIHYTLGAPCFKDYRATSMAENWLKLGLVLENVLKSVAELEKVYEFA